MQEQNLPTLRRYLLAQIVGSGTARIRQYGVDARPVWTDDDPVGNARSNSLQVKATKRYANGFTLLAFWTWMKNMSTLQSVPALGTHPASGSTASRAETREQLSKATYDLLVIGGGILGISTAWHAAQAGLRVALVDAGDFAGATSSASSKLLHGGLRYLQTGAVKLVAENHFERRAVSRKAVTSPPP